jgi:hypothetical protein
MEAPDSVRRSGQESLDVHTGTLSTPSCPATWVKAKLDIQAKAGSPATLVLASISPGEMMTAPEIDGRHQERVTAARSAKARYGSKGRQRLA